MQDPKVKAHIQKVVSMLQFAARQAIGTPTGVCGAYVCICSIRFAV